MAAQHRSNGTARPRRAAATLLAVAGAFVALVLAGSIGTGGSYAAWSSTAAIPGAMLKTGNAQLTVTSAQSLTHTFSSSSTSAVGAITINNTGTSTLRVFTPSITLAGSNALAQNISVQIWRLATGASCPATAATGTASYAWNAIPGTWLSGQGALASGASVTYCMLSTANSTALTTDASLTFSPAIAVSGGTDASTSTGWSTGAQSAPAAALSTAATSSSWSIVGNTGTTVTTTVTPQPTGGYCFDVLVASTSGNKITWTITINASAAPFSTHTTASAWTWPNGMDAAGAYYSSTNPPTIVLTGIGGTGNGTNGDTNGNDKTVGGGITVDLDFCVGGS